QAQDYRSANLRQAVELNCEGGLQTLVHNFRARKSINATHEFGSLLLKLITITEIKDVENSPPFLSHTSSENTAKDSILRDPTSPSAKEFAALRTGSSVRPTRQAYVGKILDKARGGNGHRLRLNSQTREL